ARPARRTAEAAAPRHHRGRGPRSARAAAGVPLRGSLPARGEGVPRRGAGPPRHGRRPRRAVHPLARRLSGRVRARERGGRGVSDDEEHVTTTSTAPPPPDPAAEGAGVAVPEEPAPRPRTLVATDKLTKYFPVDAGLFSRATRF